MKIPCWPFVIAFWVLSPWLLVNLMGFIAEPYGGIVFKAEVVLVIHFTCWLIVGFLIIVSEIWDTKIELPFSITTESKKK